MPSKSKGEPKYYEVRWYNRLTGQFMGEARVLPAHYNNDIDQLKREVHEALMDRDEELDIKILEVFGDGTAEKRDE